MNFKIIFEQHTLAKQLWGKKLIWIIYERTVSDSVDAVFSHNKQYIRLTLFFTLYAQRLPDGYSNAAIHIVLCHGCCPILVMFIWVICFKTIDDLQEKNRNTCQHPKSNRFFFQWNTNQYRKTLMNNIDDCLFRCCAMTPYECFLCQFDYLADSTGIENKTTMRDHTLRVHYSQKLLVICSTWFTHNLSPKNLVYICKSIIK